MDDPVVALDDLGLRYDLVALAGDTRGMTLDITPDGRVVVVMPEYNMTLTISQDDAHKLWTLLGAIKNDSRWTGPAGWGNKPSIPSDQGDSPWSNPQRKGKNL